MMVPMYTTNSTNGTIHQVVSQAEKNHGKKPGKANESAFFLQRRHVVDVIVPHLGGNRVAQLRGEL